MFGSRLIGREEIAEGVVAVRLARPEGFAFRAGQWCFLNLPDLGLKDERGIRRHLSLAGCPEEADLLFATKVSPSAFKQTLVRLSVGAEIGLEAPKGALRLPEDAAVPLVLLAGGIGITPFRSMLTHVVRAATGHRVTLFYSNRRPEEAPFLDEVLALDGARPGVRVVATMTRMHDSARHWDGPTGRLGPELVQERCPHWREARFLLAGPPPMVEALQGLLGELGVPPERVQPEKFLGY